MKIIGFINDKFEEVISVVCLAVMVAIVFLQVICRYILHASLPWSEEIARYLFLWLIWLGASYATKEDKHIKLDILVSKLKGTAQVLVKGLAFLVWLAFMVLLSILSLQLTINIFNLGQVSTAAQLPMWIAYASVTVGVILCVLRMVQKVIMRCSKERRGEEEC